MTTAEIKKMNTIQRLQTMETIWGFLLNDENEIESPEWHDDVLSERKQKIANGKAKFITIEKLRAGYKS